MAIGKFPNVKNSPMSLMVPSGKIYSGLDGLCEGITDEIYA